MSDVLSVHCLHVGHSRTTYSYVCAYTCVCICGHVSEHYSVFQSFVLRTIVLRDYNFCWICIIVNVSTNVALDVQWRCSVVKREVLCVTMIQLLCPLNDSCGRTKRILFHVEIARLNLVVSCNFSIIRNYETNCRTKRGIHFSFPAMVILQK